jgi:hypothetical protein
MVVDRLIGLASPAAALRRATQLIEQQQFAAAFPLLSRAAKAGIPEAEFHLARAYLEGAGVPPSQTEGLRWLRRAASRGNAEAQSLLAALCVHGFAGAETDLAPGEEPDAERLFAVQDAPASPDFDSALKWARQAAEAGSAKGQALLAYVLTYGPDEMRDLAQAHHWYERSAAAGCPEGNLGYALSLVRRATSEDHRRLVIEQLRPAAAAELPTAMYLLAVLTEAGFGTPPDALAAGEYYQKAAEKGHRPAQVRWGMALIEGRIVAPDVVAGESWLRRAALAGDANAAMLVGNLYVQSGPLPPNYVEAAAWYRRAAELGHNGAARALASLHLTGAGVVRDDAEAARWLRVAGEAGDEASQVDLANLVLQGAGAPDDAVKVAGWFKQAASVGDLLAAFNVGVCLDKGIGFQRDDEQAARWLRRAAEGVPEAQYMYGRMLAEGRGVALDLKSARAWLARAADLGLPDAQVALAEMMVNGRGGAPNPVAANALFERAAAKGHSGAMFALGAMHGGGHGFPIDRATAQRWFRAAAELGHGHAQLMLGRYLAGGVAGERKAAEARVWLERAVAQGVHDAKSDLSELSLPRK